MHRMLAGVFFCMICNFMICSRPLIAQYGSLSGSFTPNNKSHYIGEEDTVGTFSISSYSGCTIINIYQISGGPFTYHYSFSYGANTPGIYGYVTYTPTDTATVTASAKFSIQSGYNGGYCGNGWDSCYVTAYAAGTSDSIFRIRPTYQSISLNTDTILKEWTGHFQMTFDNNTVLPTMVSNWKIKEDSSLYTLQASIHGKPIASYSSKPFERRDTIDFAVTVKHGPIYYNSLRHAILEAIVSQNGQDSIYRERLDLTIPAAPYQSISKLNKDSILFTNGPNTSASQQIMLYLDSAFTSYTIEPVSQPFSLTDTKVNGTTRGLVVTCDPQSGGVYIDRVRINIFKPDFNGDSRQDSLFINLRAESTSANDEIFWQSFGSTSAAKKLYFPKKGNIYASTGKELFYSIDGGKSWVSLSIKDTICEQISFDTNRNIYRIGADEGLYLSADNGSSWVIQPVPTFSLNCFLNNSIPIYIYSLCKSTDALYVSGSRYVSYACGRSIVSGGESGTFVKYDNQTSWQNIGNTGSLYLDSADNIVILSGNKFNYPSLNYNWAAPDSITAFAVDDWGNYLIGTQASGLYSSTDNGYSWEYTALSGQNISALAAAPSGEIFVASYGNGVFRSTDNGKNWEGVNGGLTTKKVNDIIATPGEPLYLATEDAWVWKSKWIVPEKNAVPKYNQHNDMVFDISPNPAESRISIRYILPESISAKLSFRDLLGNEIRVPESDKILRGEGVTPIDISTLSEGIYFCSLQTSSGIFMKKIIHY